METTLKTQNKNQQTKKIFHRIPRQFFAAFAVVSILNIWTDPSRISLSVLANFSEASYVLCCIKKAIYLSGSLEPWRACWNYR